MAYLKKTREIKEEIYIACSPKNALGERRIKIGRTAYPDSRGRDYANCGMEIVWSMRMEHTNRLETLVLMGIKLDFKELGCQSGNLFVKEIQVLGRKVGCPCGKTHNDMFLTTSSWDDTHMDELKNSVFEFSRLDRIDSEDLYKMAEEEEDEEAEMEEPLEGNGQDRDNGAGEPTPTRAKSEERAAEIHAELVRAQKMWVRGVEGRLIRTN